MSLLKKISQRAHRKTFNVIGDLCTYTPSVGDPFQLRIDIKRDIEELDDYGKLIGFSIEAYCLASDGELEAGQTFIDEEGDTYLIKQVVPVNSIKNRLFVVKQ